MNQRHNRFPGDDRPELGRTFLRFAKLAIHRRGCDETAIRGNNAVFQHYVDREEAAKRRLQAIAGLSEILIQNERRASGA